MTSQTNEQALESAIERHLTGTCLEELKDNVGEAPAQYSADSLYRIAYASDYNKKYALDEKLFWEFLEETQADELEKIKKHSPNDW